MLYLQWFLADISWKKAASKPNSRLTVCSKGVFKRGKLGSRGSRGEKAQNVRRTARIHCSGVAIRDLETRSVQEMLDHTHIFEVAVLRFRFRDLCADIDHLKVDWWHLNARWRLLSVGKYEEAELYRKVVIGFQNACASPTLIASKRRRSNRAASWMILKSWDPTSWKDF